MGVVLIVSQDPGKKTGIATWSEQDILDPAGQVFIPAGFDSLELSVEEYFGWMTRLATFARGQEVKFVSESFVITAQTAKNSQAGWSLELIGVMKFVAHCWFQAEVKLQTPSVGKTFGTDVKLKYVGWFQRGRGHANDAARHLMTFAATRGLVFTNEQLQGFALA